MIKCMWGLTLGVVIATGCTQNTASDGPVLDVQPEIDVAVPPVPMDMGLEPGSPDATIRIDYCSDESTVDLNAEAVAQDDGSLRYEGEYGTRNTYGGSCGGEGREAIFRFTAPMAGQWSFLSAPQEGSLDTVIYARSTCDDGETELGCNDDIVPQVRLESSLQLTLEAGQQIYIFADTYGGTPKPFYLTARIIPTVALGEACDRDGQRIGCPEGAFCAVPADTNEDEGVCTPDNPPVVDDLRAFRTGNLVTMSAEGHDDGADVTEGLLQLYNGGQRIVLNEQGADTFIVQPIDSVTGESTFVFRMRFDLNQDAWRQANRIQFMLRDSRGGVSEPVAANFEDLPVVDVDCDRHRILNQCGDGTACLDRDEDDTFACEDIHPPQVNQVKGFLNRNAQSLAFQQGQQGWVMGYEVRGFDEDEDVTGIRLQLVKRMGAEVEAGRTACTVTDDCGEGRECVDGACRTPCGADTDCGTEAREVCGAEGLCTAGCRSQACESDDDCPDNPDGLTCNLETSRCENEGGDAFLPDGWHDACPEGEYCDDVTVPEDFQCANNIAQGEFGFDTLESTDGNFLGFMTFRLAQEFDFDHVRIWAFDSEGLESEARHVTNFRPPVEGEAGDACDPLGARLTCNGACMPAEDGPVCGEPETACPAEWGSVTELALEANDVELRLDGDLTEAPNNTRGTCGGGVAQNIYRFTAPTTGKYSFVARGRGANTVVYVRRYCGVGADFPNLERGCSTRIGRRFNYGLVRGGLEAGETAYVFVDGDEGWRGAYELVVTRLPDYEEVDF